MGEIASGRGYSLEVGKNCEKLTKYTSNIVLKLIVLEKKDTHLWKISYNNSKFGKACVAGTETASGEIHAENKYFNFQWNIFIDERTGEFFVIGNHTKKSEDNKKSVALFESMTVDSSVLQANKSKFSSIAQKITKNSKLAEQIKKLKK